MGLARLGVSLSRPLGPRDGVLAFLRVFLFAASVAALWRLCDDALAPAARTPIHPDCHIYALGVDLLKGIGPVLAAIAAAMVAALAWLAKSLLSFLIWHHRECSIRIDLLTAIRSEIVTNATGEATYADPAQRDRVIGRIIRAAHSAPHIPYAVTTERPPVAKPLTDQFALLAPSVAKRVSAYVNLSDGLDAQVKDIRSKDYAALARHRQAAIWDGICQLGQMTVMAGAKAEHSLQKHRRRQYANLNLVRAGVAAFFAVTAVALVEGGPRWVNRFEKRAAVWVDACETSRASLQGITGPRP